MLLTFTYSLSNVTLAEKHFWKGKSIQPQHKHKLKTCLPELELWSSKSTTNIQNVHVEAQIHLNRNIKQKIGPKGISKIM